MDEVENPSLPAAGESSPTLRPIDEDEDAHGAVAGVEKPALDAADADGLVGNGEISDSDPHSSQTGARIPARPALQREPSGPSPLQPPPAPPPAQLERVDLPPDAPDSLTLADLKRLRSSFPSAQPEPKKQLLDFEEIYDFEYQDAQSLPVELEEWFSYSDEEQFKLRKCKAAFNEEWRATKHGTSDWLDVTEDARRMFVKERCGYLARDESEYDATTALMILTYVGLGVWDETAGRQEGVTLEKLFPDSTRSGSRLEDYGKSSLQLQWIVAMVDTLYSCGCLKAIYSTLQKLVENDFMNAVVDTSLRNEAPQRRHEERMEMWCCLTLMYLFVEVARTTSGERSQKLRQDIVALEPNILNYFTQVVSRLRWDDTAVIPLTKMLLLSWKTILVLIGGFKDIEETKASLKEEQNEMDDRGQPLITASPLDYHLFRQEISSKYPAYQPPPPFFPLEPENNSILPPLRHRHPSSSIPDAFFAGAPNVGTNSVLHQPVHIATPAPSPPPSPGGPGKAGKKQNYQTNQMFPFLYPPLDTSSNELGGKGSTELQDVLVGRKWEGSDIPTSILEAIELFAKRMRATRGMKQLWEARVDFMKYERGWKMKADSEGDVDESEFADTTAQEETSEGAGPPPQTERRKAEQGEPLSQTDGQRRLTAAGNFYRDSLPYLQSLVIMLLRVVLQSVTDLVTKGNGQNGLQAGIQFNETNGIGSVKPLENGMDANGNSIEDTAEELDRLRSQEIACKAITAILVLLLKWFKVSHILQYEYMTQLLLDANYVPLILKMWQTQEFGRACHYRLDREELNFFHFCQENSRRGVAGPKDNTQDAEAEESEDEAMPPPIKLKRDEESENPLSPTSPAPDFDHPPEVDELGYPQTPLPHAPIKSYSYRNIFTTINYLRILQKITRRKTHRALLLVSYKSSTSLKKTLRIPVHLLRYYTLKLFKSQVPFCGRKWRQGNMKIITAVWLSVPAELRDDWLSGGGGGMGGACVGDVDGTVEDALPLEQSLRALTHWWNVRNFPDMVGVDKGMMDEDADFFARELEKMEFLKEGMAGEEAGEEQEQPGMMDEATWQGPVEGY